jgi:hypothetical protein
MDIKFTDGGECFGMGGPWLGNCFINNRQLKKQFLVDNFVYTSEEKYVALSRYSDISNWAKDREFKIVIADLKNQIYFISKKGFRHLFLESMDSKRIVFYEAFHNEIADLKRAINFSADNFDGIQVSDFFE